MKSFLWILIFISFTTVTFARSAYKVVGNSVVINLDGFGVKSKLLKIEVWSQNTIRVTSTMNDTFSEKPSLFGELSTEPIKFKVSYAQTNIEITTSNIIVNIAEDGMLRILNRAGRKLLVESSRAYNLADSVGSAYKINQKFFLNRGEHIFGFGHENNITRHTLRSESFDVKQGKSSIATPTFFSEKGFAFIWDNYSATNFKDTPANLSITSDLADDIQYFVINGPDWNSIVAEIRNFTGAAPMLPKWAFGYHLNPETFSSPEQVNAAIKNYQSIGVPVENSVVDYSLYNEEKEITANNTNKRLQNAEAFFTLKEKYEKEQSQNKESRTIIPTHINLSGIQKYGTFTTAGDISSCWTSLESQVSAGINASFSGQPYWSTTIGGITSNNECSAEPYDELMVRWYQFAAFTPIFQGVSTSKISDKKSIDIINETIKLRYRLLPYIYSNAYTASTLNKNIMQSLLSNYRDEEKVHTLNNQYLFGTSIMVCAVTKSEQTSLPIYLPAANNWIDFWTGKTYQGGSTINANLSIENIPVFVKAGSIIPMGIVPMNSADSLNAPIEIRVYTGDDASFTLYEDEGDGYGYQSELFSTISFSYKEKNKTLSIESIEGDYPGIITERTFNVVFVSEENGIGTLQSQNATEVLYNGKKEKVKFK